MILAFWQSILLTTDSQFLIYLLGRWRCLVTKSCPTLFGLQPTMLQNPWDSPGKNTGVGSHSLLQGPSWPRDGIHVSCTAGGIFFFFFLTAEAPGKPSGKVLHILNLFWGFEIQAFMTPEGLTDRQEKSSQGEVKMNPLHYLFLILIYWLIWLCRVFVAACGVFTEPWGGFVRHGAPSLVVALRLSCSMGCWVLAPNQVLSPCPVHCNVDS